MSISIVIAALIVVAAAAHRACAGVSVRPPARFVEQALCVHAGRHYTSHRYRGAQLQYRLFGHGYYLLHPDYDDIPHGPAGADGEGSWTGKVGSLYGGGMSFMVGTWNRAAELSHGAVPYASSTSAIAAAAPAVQIEAAYLIVVQDHHSWGEWPQTSKACGW